MLPAPGPGAVAEPQHQVVLVARSPARHPAEPQHLKPRHLPKPSGRRYPAGPCHRGEAQHPRRSNSNGDKAQKHSRNSPGGSAQKPGPQSATPTHRASWRHLTPLHVSPTADCA
eukprot:g32932.t1